MNTLSNKLSLWWVFGFRTWR